MDLANLFCCTFRSFFFFLILSRAAVQENIPYHSRFLGSRSVLHTGALLLSFIAHQETLGYAKCSKGLQGARKKSNAKPGNDTREREGSIVRQKDVSRVLLTMRHYSARMVLVQKPKGKKGRQDQPPGGKAIIKQYATCIFV